MSCAFRGKRSGHDVDILLSHPKEGEEKELLPALLQALERKGLVLMGRLEASTYTQEVLVADFKTTSMRGQLDHFQKWLGICKFEKRAPSSDSGDCLKSAAAGCSAAKKLRKDAEESDSTSEPWCPSPQSVTDKADEKPVRKGSKPAQNETYAPESTAGKEEDNQDETGRGVENPDSHTVAEVAEREAQEESSRFEPKPERRRTPAGEPLSPRELAASERSWRARRVDLIVAPYSQYYYALVGWTGNKQFNRDLRLYAQKQLNMKLTSHGLWDLAEVRKQVVAWIVVIGEGVGCADQT